MSKIERFVKGGPRFGTADINNCEKEKIHIPGSIQPHGALLVLDEPSLTICRASQNAANFLLRDDDQRIIGLPLESIHSQLTRSITKLLENDWDGSSTALNRPEELNYDIVVHRALSSELVVEFEPICAPTGELSAKLHQGTVEITDAASLQSLADTAARIFKNIFGYDRVMIYRFASEGHGEVFAEQCEPEMETYLGNRYPATDIPQVARELYKLSRVRMLADVDYQPCPIRPRTAVGVAEEFDMSFCHLRSMSPMHIEYLRNMGVGATLVTSLMSGEKLWGLITCNHNQPKTLGYQARVLAELLTEIVATRISALEGLARTRAELGVQQFEQVLIESISRDGDWKTAIGEHADRLLRPLDAIGAAIIHDDDVISIGESPDSPSIRNFSSWLNKNSADNLYYTSSISSDLPEFAELGDQFAGVLACPISNLPSEYLMWFRPEHIQVICWGGPPQKTVRSDNGVDELTPRRSFEKWTEELKNTSDNWSETNVSVASLISASIADVVQQFRAMRIMIAHNQLESLTEQITHSYLPALIADASGNILVRNEAFDELLWSNRPALPHISDLSRFFEETAFASRHLRQLLEHHESWHGRATLDSRPIMIRADTIFASAEQVLGFVILLTDISDRQMAENARQRFPEETIERLKHTPPTLDSGGKETYELLLDLVVENAQLAALEITDGIDVQRIPAMLKGVETSVSRTTRLISNLLQHRAESSRKPDR